MDDNKELLNESHPQEKKQLQTDAGSSLTTRSRCSSSSKHSTRLSASVAAVKARAKAAAAHAQLIYAEEEAEAMKQQADIQAKLHVLQVKKMAAAATAEATSLEAAAQQMDEGSNRDEHSSISSEHKVQRVHEYVNNQPYEQNCQPVMEHDYANPFTPLVPLKVSQKSFVASPFTPLAPPGAPSKTEAYEGHQVNLVTQLSPSHMLKRDEEQQAHQELLQLRPPINHQSTEPACCYKPYRLSPPTRQDSSPVEDVAQYLMRRELVSATLQKFDDEPQNYRGWKASFLNVIKGLSLTPREELDLLCKWLGPQSAVQAKRVSSTQAHDVTAGLQMVWRRLEEMYGAPEVIEHSLFKKIEEFPKISARDGAKLRELGDLLLELELAKAEGFSPGLAYLDTARGVNPIVEKLPYALQEKWITKASNFKTDYNVMFPPFPVFTRFIQEQARIRNDPSFFFQSAGAGKMEKPAKNLNRTQISVRKTDIIKESGSNATESDKIDNPDKQCPIHKKPHPLRKCRSFRSMTLEERKTYLKENRICFRCCASTKHGAKNCTVETICMECESKKHISALHPGPPPNDTKLTKPPPELEHHGEEPEEKTGSTSATTLCTEVCGERRSPRSCAKICLAKVYPDGQMDKAVKLYAVLDDQSNRSLARSEFFNLFGVRGNEEPYTLKTCSGLMEMEGRRAKHFIIESIDGHIKVPLPPLLECDMIPEDRSEIPSPEVAHHHPHLEPIAHKIPAIDERAQILLLLGRDVLRLHKVREQRNGPQDAPFAQRLDLGWVVIGDVCLGGTHKPISVETFKTNTLLNGRPSYLSPCTSSIHVKEKLSVNGVRDTHHRDQTDSLGDTVFIRKEDDESPAPSVDDKQFLTIMEREMYQDESNTWVAPLPFATPRQRLPNNRAQALNRLYTLRKSLDKKANMKDHFIKFMQRMLVNQQAELAPSLEPSEECWYLPLFGVYHPQKPGQIRVVFDSSAKHEGLSLNDVLLSGPDLNNTLVGVLMRFRREPVAITADVEQMFYCFSVREDHRNYLRFLWYRDNDLAKEVTEYRMTVHVFGNSPSPAVAIYGLRRAALAGEMEHGKEAWQFVTRNFYVDDGLTSLPTETEAVNLLQKTQNMLAESNLRLHKVASNSSKVMEAFPAEDLAKDLKDLELGSDPLPLQRSLGLSWSLESDAFCFQVSREEKPFTKRGVLSTVNSLFDPLGFVAPITVQGKALIRELASESGDWDDPLPPAKEKEWKAWKESLVNLEPLHIPRCYVPLSLSSSHQRELYVFADASSTAIASVAYIRVLDKEGQCFTGLVMGKAKLAPKPAHTIPRLELCAAVLAVEMAELICQEMDLDFQAVRYFTDSKVILGYLHNTSRRFYVYVSNRVSRIRNSSSPSQWHHISTEHNPADIATRPIPACLLQHTCWFSGPSFLRQNNQPSPVTTTEFDLISPEHDPEMRPEISAFVTKVVDKHLSPQKFERFSTWKGLIRGMTKLVSVARSRSKLPEPKPEHPQIQARMLVIQSVQQSVFKEELKQLEKREPVSKTSPLSKLDPFIDPDGVLRVGGRLSQADLPYDERHPVVLPKKHHVSTLLVRKYHQEVSHQGRHLTEGALRSAGVWIIGARRLVSSVIYQCVTCRKLRRQPQEQKMASLPVDRLVVEPPFTRVGLDVFGPWSVVSRRTRGGSAENKRWAVLFTCLATRAVHIEVIETMSTSSFINALRRFFAIRGPSKVFRSDRGTNFVGACKELKISMDDSEVQDYLKAEGCSWTFNAPHSSHMGGSWERMIGVARRILDAMLLQSGPIRLSHEVLTTLMAEVMAIINARPLVPVSTDPESLTVLTPAMLLTRKACAAPAPEGEFDLKDLYKKQWRHVQCLADTFWKKWKQEYLTTLQSKNKWIKDHYNIQVGDVVLLKEEQVKRNEWPIGLIVKSIPSEDKKVRKVEVRVVRQGTPRIYLRPVSHLILLFPKEPKEQK